MDGNNSVRAGVEAMVGQSTGSMVVLDSGQVSGFFTERDLLSRVVAMGFDPGEVRLKEVITRDLITVSYDCACADALKLMKEHECRHLLVYDANNFVGVLSIRDLAQGVGEIQASKDFMINLLGGLTMLLAVGIIALLVFHGPKMFELVRRVIE
jgi:signal-transduction protein with cAMP-binding, CBS, and nucleotidyltransferase domain